VLHYLGRYTHRVAISNHRLVTLADEQVIFRWRDSAHNNEQKLLTLSLDEFLRRFLLHLLPKGFVRGFGVVVGMLHEVRPRAVACWRAKNHYDAGEWCGVFNIIEFQSSFEPVCELLTPFGVPPKRGYNPPGCAVVEWRYVHSVPGVGSEYCGYDLHIACGQIPKLQSKATSTLLY
jgi:hypothetical protein